MMPLLAQAPTPQEVYSWLSVVGWLSVIVTSFIIALGKLSGRGAKTEIANDVTVKPHPGVVSRDELKQVHGRIERERNEINDAIASVRADAERRSDKLDAKLDENTRMTSEMRGEVKQMNQNIHGLSTSLTSFLQHQAKR